MPTRAGGTAHAAGRISSSSCSTTCAGTRSAMPDIRTSRRRKIDRIANEGVNFKNAFCTTSLCSPSRASLLSGVYAHKHGVTNNFTEFPAGMNSFPKVLQQAGYATAYVGKYHMGEENDEPRPGVRVFRHPQGPGQVLRHRVQSQRRAARGEERLLHHRRHRHRPRLVTARSRGKPWMMILGHKAPHSFYTPEAEVRARL